MFTVRTLVVLLAAFVVCAVARPGAQTPARPRFAVEETTIAQVHSAFVSGSLTCRHLVETYLARITQFDQKGPALNAIASLNPNALAEADRLDGLFSETGLTGPLHCVPVIAKDNLETQGWETTGGSLALKGFIPGRDATAIARLKAAGAIILAKSNMADLALSALATVNRIQGRTKNPYALDRVPAGSSGGTAVAIAANFGLVGLGTDTGNSVRGPAAHTSIVGIRPTMGLTSRTGMIPLDVLSDVIGPMARTVEDAAAVLEVLVGWDPSDPATAALEALPVMPQVRASMDEGLGGVRIGVLRQAYLGGPLKIDGQIAKVFTRALSDLKSLGVEIVDPVSLDMVRQLPGAENCHGLRYDLNQYLESQGPLVPVHSLAEIISTGKYDPSIEEELFAMQARPQAGSGSPACEASATYREGVAAALTDTMERHRVDVLIYPTWSQPPQTVFNMPPEEAGQSLRFATASGFPALTVPMGFAGDVLPSGLSFLGRAWSEERLIRIAYGYEQATRYRRPPVLAPPMPPIH